MTSTTLALATVLALGAAAPAFAQSRDTGSMAFPAPLPQGSFGGTTIPRGAPDAGNAGLPGGAVGGPATSGNASSTGSLASPAPQGQAGTTPVK